jgi:hypothetical protein
MAGSPSHVACAAVLNVPLSRETSNKNDVDPQSHRAGYSAQRQWPQGARQHIPRSGHPQPGDVVVRDHASLFAPAEIAADARQRGAFNCCTVLDSEADPWAQLPDGSDDLRLSPLLRCGARSRSWLPCPAVDALQPRATAYRRRFPIQAQWLGLHRKKKT